MTVKVGDQPMAQSALETGDGKRFVEVHDEDGRVSTIELLGPRCVIGRNPGLPVVLPHERVSRLHAAFISDPYDRWWIHDLGSTNGTFVNGTKVTERLLNPGDGVQIGPYRLLLRTSEKQRNRSSTVPPPRASEAPSTERGRVSVPARVESAATLAAIACARSVFGIEDKRTRLKALCEFTISDRFPGLWAAVLRVHKTSVPGNVIHPVRRASLETTQAGIDHDLVALGTEQREVLLGSGTPRVVRLRPRASEYLVTCQLETHQAGADVLCVALPDECDPGEWPGLLAVLVDAYRHANELWDMRGQLYVNAAVDYELQMARQLQDSLMPRSPSLEGLELAVGYEPSHWVGGDYVDALRMADGRVLLAVADVCGKGMQAALVASSVHTLVHVLVESTTNLPELMSRTNAHLSRYLPAHSFVTMVCVAVDTARGELEVVNMGHPAPLLVSSDGRVRTLQSAQNTALGMSRARPEAARYGLAPDEVLLLYTDGLSEPESSRADAGDLTRSLGECVQIIASASDGEIGGIQRNIARVIQAQRAQLTARDDVAFLLARLSGEHRRTAPTAPGLTAAPPPVAFG